MARYLIVADQTAASPELLAAVLAIADDVPGGEFVLLVPATKVEHLFVWDEGETKQAARARAEFARTRLEETGVRVIQAKVGDASPLLAIADEMRAQPEYDAVVICTFPLGLSRWLRMDLPRRIRQEYSLPVIHVVAERRRLPETAGDWGTAAAAAKASRLARASSRTRDIKRAAAKERYQ